MPLFSKTPPEQQFWEWFLREEDRLFQSDPSDTPFQKELSKRLTRFHDGLTWEVSSAQSGRREFIISADGIAAHADAVEQLADAAPLNKLPRWRIIRFRPRIPDYEGFTLGMRGPDGVERRIGAEQIDCMLGRHGDLAEVTLFIEGCPESDDRAFMQMGFLMLDMALGEYDMICRVGPVQVLPRETPDPPPAVRLNWAELRRAFDELCGGEPE
jgi:hypothetical protein